MEAPDILLEGPPPRDGHGKEKCVEPSVVKTFTDITARGQQNSFFTIGNRLQLFGDGSSLLRPHAALQHHNVFNKSRNSGGKFVHLAGPFCEQNRGASVRQMAIE